MASQFVAQVQTLAKSEMRAQALHERLDRLEAEPLRSKISARRAVKRVPRRTLHERENARKRPILRKSSRRS
jgi:hypothetical protein